MVPSARDEGAIIQKLTIDSMIPK